MLKPVGTKIYHYTSFLKTLSECMCNVNNNLTEFLTKHESNIIMGINSIKWATNEDDHYNE